MATAEEKALAVVDAECREYVPAVVVTPEEVKRNLQRLERVIKEVMREGIDFDTLPGTQKPSLLKPGAERLLQFFGFGHKVICVDRIEDWQAGMFYYRYKVQVFKPHMLPDGTIYERVIAECEGSANSKEAKYRYRWVPEWKLPPSVDQKTTYWEERKDKQSRPYKMYRLENDDPYSLVNVLQKMAIKRALVGAALQATATSDMFTQDLEDMPDTYVDAVVVETEEHGQDAIQTDKPKHTPKEGNGKRDSKWWAKYFQNYVNAQIAKDIEDAHRVARETAGLREGESLDDLSDRELNQLLMLAIQNAKAKAQAD